MQDEDSWAYVDDHDSDEVRAAPVGSVGLGTAEVVGGDDESGSYDEERADRDDEDADGAAPQSGA